MPWPYDHVILVFNPHSTGDAPARARDLAAELAERAPDLPVVLRPTEHAGHARELARDAARSGRPLIVSVSGDGGYNEVINGVMAAGASSAMTAVHAAGNANDHRRATRERPLADAIIDGDTRMLDLLQLIITPSGTNSDSGGDAEVEVRYAHSYVGLGLTPAVAIELEKGGKGSLREVVFTIRTYSEYRPFILHTDHGREKIDSLILANIPEMAKYATLSDGRPDDGQFEVIILRHTAKWRLLATAIRAAVRGLGRQPTARHYWFRTESPIPMQIDGELVELGAATSVSVDIAPAALTTIS